MYLYFYDIVWNLNHISERHIGITQHQVCVCFFSLFRFFQIVRAVDRLCGALSSVGVREQPYYEYVSDADSMYP